MTNSINRKQHLITPEKAAWFIPFFVSAGISILLIIFYVIPQYIKSNMVSLELNGLVQKKNELDDLKSQYNMTHIQNNHCVKFEDDWMDRSG